MIGIIICLLTGALIFVLGTNVSRRANYPPVLYVLMLGFFLRMVFQSFSRDLPIYSYGAGGDCQIYEELSLYIVEIWEQNGISFIQNDRLPELGLTSLPPNIFAFVAYLNGGSSRAGCTALIALAAALTYINIFELGRELGGQTKSAFAMATMFSFSPAYMLYTSDMYKDGIVVALTLGAVGSAIRLGKKLSVLHLLIGLTCIFSLAFVRNYLIYVTIAPLFVGLVGFRSKSIARTATVLVLEIIGCFILASFSTKLNEVATTAQDTFEFAVTDGLASNQDGGSGVVFAGDTPFASFGTKLVYTLFSPFPWQPGSIALHVGKIDAAVMFYFAYRSVRAAPRVGFATLLTVLAFLVPCTIMYTTTMANIGLIVRQRLVIVAGLAVLAALYSPKSETDEAEETDEDEEDDEDEEPVDAGDAVPAAGRAALPGRS